VPENISGTGLVTQTVHKQIAILPACGNRGTLPDLVATDQVAHAHGPAGAGEPATNHGKTTPPLQKKKKRRST
jgi:hypothetical protein